MDRIYVSSRQNETVKRIAALSDKSKRNKESVFVVEGAVVLFEALEKGIFPEAIAVRKSIPEKTLAELEEKLSDKNIKLIVAEDFVFEKMTSEKSSDGFVSVFGKKSLKADFEMENDSFFIALERVQDPGNVGTVIRSALAFGASAVFTVNCADAFSVKAVRSSMGSVFSIPVIDFESTELLYDYLRKNKIKTVATALHTKASDIIETDLSGKVCAVIGNEGNGLSDYAVENADSVSVIPISGAESLNAAVASSVFLWEMKRRR